MRTLMKAVVLLLAAVSSAQAGPEQDLSVCAPNKPSVQADQAKIPACTRLLKSGLLSRGQIAIAHNNRGNAYSRLRQFRHAIADFNQAIRINPQYARAYNNRGVTYGELKQYRRAIASTTSAGFVSTLPSSVAQTGSASPKTANTTPSGGLIGKCIGR